jgi:hypothetical protein
VSTTVPIDITVRDLPPLPTPKPGGDPIFQWDTYAKVRCGEIHSAVKRFAYWDERDGKPLAIGFEAYIDGLPDTCGVADVVATHPDVFDGLAAVAAKTAELLKEVQRRHVMEIAR